ncbi:unnamed protein product [Alternaria burnsii]|nr:unnamed protein product [Alternaria burnsii]
MPYMATRIRRRYLIQTLLEKHTWLCEVLFPAPMPEVSVRSNLQQTMAVFWKSPTQTITKLVKLTRMWFFTLLRYTYRMRFFDGNTSYRSDLYEPNIQFYENRRYISEMTEREVCRLVCIPEEYGATFYRSCYKSAKRCPAWTKFCAGIQTFCKSVGLLTSLKDPEQCLNTLLDNVSSLVLQQRWLQTASHLDETAILARSTERQVKELEKRVISAQLMNLNFTDDTKQQVEDLALECNELRSTVATLSCSQRCDANLSLELQRQRKSWEKELQCLRNRIEENETMNAHCVMTMAEQIEKSCINIGHPTTASSGTHNVELLVACRWLLERLPAFDSKQQGFGNRWRLFWQGQWKQYKHNTSRDDHPLRTLVCDEKYNKIGKGLYRTLSSFLHEYGRLRIDPLDPDVQKVMDVISPIHYDSNGRIDIKAERKRWCR